MTVLLVVLVTLAGLCLGLRTTSVLLIPTAHPLDRLALSIVAGAFWTALVFEVANSYRIYDFGLGLMLSLSPAGLFDLTKWWFRSRGRRSGWLKTAGTPGWLLASRWIVLAATAGGIAAYLFG
jgi:hypothetical protein